MRHSNIACRVRAYPFAFLVVFAFTALTLSYAVPLAALECSAVETIGIESIIAVLSEMGMKTEILNDSPIPEVQWEIEGFNARVRVRDGDKSLEFRAGAPGKVIPYENMDAWNRDRRYTRTYLDDYGDPALSLDLNFEGGICQQRIRVWLRDCRESFLEWRSAIAEWE